jgi:hypothetical protein
MDELDRMFRRLVQNIRASKPEYLTRSFEVSELYQTLVPYRLNRRELELETNQDYEMALLRLLAGERGYLVGDSQMQADLKAEAESPNPDLSKFRAYATTSVSLSPDGTRALEAPVVRRPGSGSVPEIQQGGPPPAAAKAELAGRPTLGVRTAGDAPQAPGPAAAPSATVLSAAPSATRAAVGPSAASSATECRYCGGELPEGRKIVFCPHCGQNLTVRHCPACGTELDVAWKFCVTCGRGAS